MIGVWWGMAESEESGLLARIGKHLLTQNNLATAYPIVTVQQLVRDYGYDDDYADGVEWVDEEGYEQDDTRSRRLEALHNNFRDTPERYRRVGYKNRWEFVQAFFTVEAANEFRQTQAPNFKETRLFIESAHRNREWKELLSLMEGAAADA